MKLALHIGTEKTGTTSLQYWLHDNRAAIVAEGVWPCESLGVPDNRALAVMARRGDDPCDAFRRFAIASPEDHARFVAATRDALAAEAEAARAAGARVFVVSNEHLQSRLYDADTVRRVAAIVAPIFEEIEVVCVLRPQIEAVLSLASTEARVGMQVTRRRFEWVDPNVHYFDYHGLLARWSEAFGTERVLPVPFRRHPDIVAFFRRYLALSGEGCVARRPANRRLDYRAIALSNRLDLPLLLPSGVPNPNRTVFFDDLPCETPLTLSREFAQGIQARFEPGNARIAETWPSITLEDLTPDWAAYPELGTVDLLEECDIGPMLRYVVQRLNAELHFSKALTEQQRARVAHFNENFENALRFLDDARGNLEAAATFDDGQAGAGTHPGFEPMAERVARVMAEIDAHRAAVAARRPAPRGPREAPRAAVPD